MAKTKLITKSSDWTFDTLEVFDKEIGRIAKEYLNIDSYPNQIEIVTSEQMIDAYSLIGLPISYPHWSFGKSFMHNSINYQKGRQGLAYELVINSNPCISYNMEDNTACLMALVLAHAAYGHNSFFKNNYMFKEWTDANTIINDMVFARDFITKCEDKYGIDAVEEVIDACHSVQRFGIDKMKRKPKKTKKQIEERRKLLLKYEEENYNILWSTLPDDVKRRLDKDDNDFEPNISEDNILYFIENNSPNLPLWKREIIKIVRSVSQYFYPQSQTKVINEGWACFSHYHIIYKLYEEGFVDEGFMLEFAKAHSGVINQPPYNSKFYSGINPYTLGFAIFQDIKRICEEPTDEDREWFPNLVGKDWLTEVHYAMKNYRDDSFILQYLSPKVIRDLKLFVVLDYEDDDENYHIGGIHNKLGYKSVREFLYKQYQRDIYVPNIKVTGVDTYAENRLILTHYINDGKLLDEDEAIETLLRLQELWRFPIELRAMFDTGDEITMCEV
jgi:spore cortex formation protein SpoVR/YcgB (stage V sporulation)